MEKYVGEWPGLGLADLNLVRSFKPNCIRNKENVRFMGHSKSVESDLLGLYIEKCSGEDCEEEEEI